MLFVAFSNYMQLSLFPSRVPLVHYCSQQGPYCVRRELNLYPGTVMLHTAILVALMKLIDPSLHLNSTNCFVVLFCLTMCS